MIRNPIGLQEGDAFWQYTRPPLTQAGVSGLYRLFVGRAENGRLAIARCSWLGNSGTHRILNMNEADPSSALGTAVLNIALPSGFIMRPMTLLEQKLPQGKIIVDYKPDTRITAAFIENGEATPAPLSVTSCPVANPGENYCILALSWSLPEQQLHIVLDGELVATTNTSVAIPSEYIVQTKISTVEAADFSAKNSAARFKRKQRLAGFQPIPGRQRGDKDYVLNKLKSEILQLRDLLTAVRTGGLHHTFGLAGRLRSLIAVGKNPMPLVQLCAAILDEPLIVFITPKPFFIPAMAEFAQSSYGLSCDVSGRPTKRLNNPIDLDVWLDAKAGNIKTKTFTHKELLAAIGSTVGSHIDLDLHPYVVMLQSIQTDIPAHGSYQMVLYLLKVGDMTLALAQDLFKTQAPQTVHEGVLERAEILKLEAALGRRGVVQESLNGWGRIDFECSIRHVGAAREFHKDDGIDIEIELDEASYSAYEKSPDSARVFIQNRDGIAFSAAELLTWYLSQSGTSLKDFVPTEESVRSVADGERIFCVSFPITFAPDCFHMRTRNGAADLKQLMLLVEFTLSPKIRS